ncbi:transcription antitermination factor NusB [Candidatus Avelusimicrobium facis]|mgnify:CR=1 FL=1|uniref:transcription antitermination factor NusB n=1 Tax=Candidatus Avelusimicrobium facis TaxID=3416203 RepID=UPI0015B59E99
MSNRRMARECALQCLYYADSAKMLDGDKVEPYVEDFQRELGENFPFCQDLVEGTTRHLPQIDTLVSKYARNWTIDRMSVVDRSILRMAAYELVYSREKTPVPAVIDEAIELAKKYSTDNSGKFINGLLDQLKKERK